MRRDRSLWLSRCPRSRVPSFPRLREALAADVAIIGGGLTGCTAAALFAAEGIKTCLVEGAAIGQGATAADPGVLRPRPAASFVAMRQAYGLRAARQMWEMTRHAALDFAALLRRLGIRCGLDRRDFVMVAADAAEEAELRREHAMLAEAGLEAAWLRGARASAELALEARAALRLPGGGTLDPYQACLGLARVAVRRGARLYERTRATRVRAGRRGVEITTTGGPIAARAVIVATGSPGPLIRPLRRHVAERHSYRVATEPLPAPMRRHVAPAGVVIASATDCSRLIVRTTDDRLIFTGADQPRVRDRSRPRTLVQRTGQLMYELSLRYPIISGIPAAHGWDAPIALTRDGLPYIGLHRNHPHHLFAVGLGYAGPTASFLAARLLLRRYLGDAEPSDALFAFTRG